MDLVIDCWKNWNKLEGRASRKEYWLFLLSYMLVMFFVVYLMNILGIIGLVFAVVIGFWGYFCPHIRVVSTITRFGSAGLVDFNRIRALYWGNYFSCCDDT